MIVRAHPTTYAHARFRSRLEARWAAFFDLCGWRWEYEPADTDGWVPDFLLLGTVQNIPVEVKPIEWIGQSHLVYEAQAASRDDLEKVRRANRLTLVLGLYPVPLDYCQPFIGVLVGPNQDTAHFGLVRDKLDIAPDLTGRGLLTNTMVVEEADWSIVGDLWRQAGALTQWRGR